MGIAKFGKLNNVFAHTSFLKEFECLFKKNKKELLKQQDILQIQLQTLCQDIFGAVDGVHYEKLQVKTQEVYAIRNKGIYNHRVLYFIVEENAVILLTAFLEKNKSDYKIAIDRALKRISQIKKELGIYDNN